MALSLYGDIDDSRYFMFSDQASSQYSFCLDNGSRNRVFPSTLMQYRSVHSELETPESKGSSHNNLHDGPAFDDAGRVRDRSRVEDLTSSTNKRIHPSDHSICDQISVTDDSMQGDTASDSHTVVNTPNIPSYSPKSPLISRLLCLSGEVFSYDLKNLQPDPREIVDLLKCTGSERGNWMIVGASYRRQGNPRAAIIVLKAMLEVMAQHGIPEQQLKPAFLLLSGCETDLGKLTQEEGKVDHEHYQKAQEWIQKVYGTTKILNRSTISEPLSSTANKLFHPPSSDSNESQRLTHSFRPKADLPARPPSPDRSDIMREIQSLRSRFHSQAGAKRKLKDSLDLERDIRRRLEKEVDILRRERDDSRRREENALIQLQRESEDRRRAEDDYFYERDLRMKMEERLSGRRTPSPYRL
ncbi:hypothetical protein BDP27DRAFT_1331031 [Rhodocollybia butyracea]|uniref:Uncharacterized protein n=1 Tax=Rhodocollybia butyracea TaxID=206335 RepID=A0A9P5PPE3_9AGAR|nr:hypothetical protein BDP27DRAFT_1331031 [Rhodocollybia butyracea]